MVKTRQQQILFDHETFVCANSLMDFVIPGQKIQVYYSTRKNSQRSIY